MTGTSLFSVGSLSPCGPLSLGTRLGRAGSWDLKDPKLEHHGRVFLPTHLGLALAGTLPSPPRQGGFAKPRRRETSFETFSRSSQSRFRSPTSAPGRQKRQREEEKEWVSSLFIFQAILKPPEGTRTQGRI